MSAKTKHGKRLPWLHQQVRPYPVALRDKRRSSNNDFGSNWFDAALKK
ncbi:MAG: hypothetical protein ACSHX4_04815 [Opitutaceae bacterium]